MLKRLFDLVLTIPGFLLISPFLLIVALLVRVFNGSPIFFSQLRPGRNGKPFRMLKFRTMTDARDAAGNLLPDGERLTSFGRFLRSTSLDEFPALLNVLKGEMSLVGPRPLLLEYMPLYSPEQNRRHEVRPGITGWAQVNGRQNIKFSKRLEYDVWYVDHQSFVLDLKILLFTFYRVIQMDGVKSGQDIKEVDDLGLSAPIIPRDIDKKIDENYS